MIKILNCFLKENYILYSTEENKYIHNEFSYLFKTIFLLDKEFRNGHPLHVKISI